ncbi:MAG: D-sedoheptulose 7-phosphate isomerase [Saprospiraceae bacterium]|nr:D-sedoheptulose 7-phosphate isomerase [Saprospiraceae bacterium]MCB0623903.1 D-sedoheptulose 7-phosphate isomerase [Saprospiraceae bacterium]MCB0683722.1 D-sedoheptulose 7-phosphate isomerase [Saprospiraceae bacterium]
MNERIKAVLSDHIAVQQAMLADEELLQTIQTVADLTVDAFRADRKALFCGNGGSAADAQHLAAELSGRFYLDRPPLLAEALHVNTSFLTAVANDYGYEEVFARWIHGIGRAGDVFFAFSTSGNSPNMLRAVQEARNRQLTVVGFTGQTGGKMAAFCDHLIRVPSTDTPRIQEGHLLVGHLICELVETALFGPDAPVN